jgi:regulatory protein
MLSSMARLPRKLSSEEQLYTSALRALMRRAHSVYEMRTYLERRAEQPALVRQVLERLKTEQLLDDARYARQFAQYHARSRRQGHFRIARELRARGVPDRHIEPALEETFAEVDEAALARRHIERRLRQFGNLGGKLNDRKLAALYRSLLRAGFSADTIRAELRTIFRAAGELPDAPSEEVV